MNNEPVAWIWSEDGCNLGVCLDQDKQIGKQEFQDYDIPLYTHPVKELTDAIETLENLLDIADNGIREGYKTMNSHFVIEEIKQALFEIRKAQEK